VREGGRSQPKEQKLQAVRGESRGVRGQPALKTLPSGEKGRAQSVLSDAKKGRGVMGRGEVRTGDGYVHRHRDARETVGREPAVIAAGIQRGKIGGGRGYYQRTNEP